MTEQQMYCSNCGAALQADTKSCKQCGTDIAGFAVTKKQLPLQWEAKLHLIRNAVVLKQLAFAFGIPVILIFILFLVLAWPIDLQALQQAFTIVLIVAGILLTLGLIAVGLVYGGGYKYQYWLDEQGIKARPFGRTAKINTIANFLLIFSGRPGRAGIGILAQSRQVEYVAWKNVDGVTAQPDQKTITLRKGKRTLMVVACDDTHYEAVLQLAQEASARTQAAKKRKKSATG
ncbi:MAG: zinc-ribbon domain-containing protein [Kiritimatiellota bacterium]|nr:zinc-ribbon domain-containing protein [Kiritimatiellota bacterium]